MFAGDIPVPVIIVEILLMLTSVGSLINPPIRRIWVSEVGDGEMRGYFYLQLSNVGES